MVVDQRHRLCLKSWRFWRDRGPNSSFVIRVFLSMPPFHSFSAIGLGIFLSAVGSGQARSQSLAHVTLSPPAAHTLPSSVEMPVSFQTVDPDLDLGLKPVSPEAVNRQPLSNHQAAILDHPQLAARLRPSPESPLPPVPTIKNLTDRSKESVFFTSPQPSSNTHQSSSSNQLTRPDSIQQPPQKILQPVAQSQPNFQELGTVSFDSAQNLLPLNPDPRELLQPTTPNEVEIDLNQPITLQQALELARRNNLSLRVAELQLQQSREALRQAQALNFPTLSVIGELTRTENATFVVSRPPINIDFTAQNDVIQRVTTLLGTEQATAEQTLAQDIANLQQILQTNQATRQDVTFAQQIAELNAGTVDATTLAPIETVGPLSPFPSFLLPQSRGLVDPTADTTDSTTDSATSIARGTLSLTYDIFTSGFRSGTIGAAREQVRFSELALQTVLDDLRLDVTNDYYDLQQADALVTVAQDTVDSASANLRNAQALERGGLATLFDVLQAEVQLAQARQDLTQAINLRTIAQRQLVQRLNLGSQVSVTAADPAAIAGLWPLSIEETIVIALQNRPELEQILAQRQIAQYNRRAALSAIGPQIQAFANLEVVDELDDNVLGAFGYAVGIQVSLNFFDGGAAKASAAQEDENIAIAETQFADTKNQLRFEVEQAYSTLRANFENIDTSLRAVDRARENVRLAQLRFQAGIGTQLDITTAQADLTQQEGNLVAAVITYNRALASLQRSTSYRQPLQSNSTTLPARSINIPQNSELSPVSRTLAQETIPWYRKGTLLGQQDQVLKLLNGEGGIRTLDEAINPITP